MSNSNSDYISSESADDNQTHAIVQAAQQCLDYEQQVQQSQEYEWPPSSQQQFVQHPDGVQHYLAPRSTIHRPQTLALAPTINDQDGVKDLIVFHELTPPVNRRKQKIVEKIDKKVMKANTSKSTGSGKSRKQEKPLKDLQKKKENSILGKKNKKKKDDEVQTSAKQRRPATKALSINSSEVDSRFDHVPLPTNMLPQSSKFRKPANGHAVTMLANCSGEINDLVDNTTISLIPPVQPVKHKSIIKQKKQQQAKTILKSISSKGSSGSKKKKLTLSDLEQRRAQQLDKRMGECVKRMTRLRADYCRKCANILSSLKKSN